MHRILTRTMAGLAAVATTASMAWAQSAAPQPPLDEGNAAWQGYMFMFLLAVAVIFVSLMPSKRSHQD